MLYTISNSGYFMYKTLTLVKMFIINKQSSLFRNVSGGKQDNNKKPFGISLGNDNLFQYQSNNNLFYC